MITSSLGPGSVPVLQFVAVFQSPLPPTHDTVAADVLGSRKQTPASAKSGAINQAARKARLFIRGRSEGELVDNEDVHQKVVVAGGSIVFIPFNRK